jgi:cytochrome c
LRIGPNLFGVVGRKSGTLPGYAYSSAMTKAGIIWGADTLPRYLMGPSKVVPGTKMTFAGLSNQQQAEDVTAYLATLK